MKRLRNSIEFKGVFCSQCSKYIDIPGIENMSLKCPHCGKIVGAKEDNKSEEASNPDH